MKVLFGNRSFLFFSLFLLALCFTGLKSGVLKESYTEIINSDGSGYYAYLPAVFIYKDPSFAKAAESEKKYAPWKNTDLYLYPTVDGRVFNKYFPGLSMLQMPFFALAFGISAICNAPLDGYSFWFQFCYLVGNNFYLIVSLILSVVYLKKIFSFSILTAVLGVLVVFFATPLWFYATHNPSLTHLYSYFLFLLFLFAIENWRNDHKWALFQIGILLGLIFLVRPSNLLILGITPFLFGTWSNFVDHLRPYLLSLKSWVQLTLPFFFLFGIFVGLNYWQKGEFFSWSYKGEGFFWTEPKLWETFFGFRTGYLVHHPIFLVALILALVQLFQKNWAMIFWLLFIFVNGYVVASWWCWDYETVHGHRALTEYSLLYLLPLFAFWKKQKSKSLQYFLTFFVLATIIIQFWRLATMSKGVMTVQRYTASTYIKSLALNLAENKQRFNYTRSCKPFGRLKSSKVLLDQAQTISLDQNTEFAHTAELKAGRKRSGERIYLRIKLEKFCDSKELQEVFLTVDATGATARDRYYWTTPLYNDRFSEKGKWTPMVFETTVHDNFSKLENYKIYIWNKGRQRIKLRQVRYSIEVYETE